MAVTPICVWPLECALGEGPVWWRAAVWFVDIRKCRIHRFDPHSGAGRSWDAPAPVGFIAPRANGHFIAGTRTGLLDFDPVTGAFAPIRIVEPELPGNRLNDGAVDPAGRLWFGSMDDGESAATGKLYRMDASGIAVADSGYVITNGPAFSPDGRLLYHTDTLQKTIHVFDVSADGALSGKRVFVRIEDGAGYPDGPVLDAEGCLWTGLFGGWAVRHYAPDGTLLEQVRFPCANVTKIAFGGADLRTVYATTARKGLDAAALAAQPLAGGLFCFAVDSPGLPQHTVDFT